MADIHTDVAAILARLEKVERENQKLRDSARRVRIALLAPCPRRSAFGAQSLDRPGSHPGQRQEAPLPSGDRVPVEPELFRQVHLRQLEEEPGVPELLPCQRGQGYLGEQAQVKVIRRPRSGM